MNYAMTPNRISNATVEIIKRKDYMVSVKLPYVHVMRYLTLDEVRNRIDKNYDCILKMEQLISLQKTDEEKLELISFIGMLYANYITGVYASDTLEHKIVEIGEKIEFKQTFEPLDNQVLIVMSKAYYIGGHTALVNDWIRCDNTKQYTIVFTKMNRRDIPCFIEDAVRQSGGKIICLVGNFQEKAKKLLQISQRYGRVLLFTHMEDVIPTLAYSNPNWKIPVYFYNHADFRFSYGFSVADIVLNLTNFDMEKAVTYRGISNEKSVFLPLPNVGLYDGKRDVFNKTEVRKKVDKKYNTQGRKLIVSMGSDFKYESVLGYEFDEFVSNLLEKSNQKSTFLIIGADKSRDKWIQLEEKTCGQAKALGLLSREEAEELISVADLYIVSFPMSAAGRKEAERFEVPYLFLNVIGRAIDKKDIRTANSVDELMEKSLDILNGNGENYVSLPPYLPEQNALTKEEWRNKWNEIYNRIDCHKNNLIHPHRYVGKAEYVNCQLMQKKAADISWSYINSHLMNGETREQLYNLDKRYKMCIFQEKNIFTAYDSLVKLSNKRFDLYLIAINWLRLKQKGKKIDDYLYRNGYYSVAIYGMSYMGENVYEELKESMVSVLYGIDEDKSRFYGELQIYTPSEVCNTVDVIINTTTIDNDIVGKEITQLDDVKVISIEEIITQLYAE